MIVAIEEEGFGAARLPLPEQQVPPRGLKSSVGMTKQNY
jgi:hypothetical protein